MTYLSSLTESLATWTLLVASSLFSLQAGENPITTDIPDATIEQNTSSDSLENLSNKPASTVAYTNFEVGKVPQGKTGSTTNVTTIEYDTTLVNPTISFAGPVERVFGFAQFRCSNLEEKELDVIDIAPTAYRTSDGEVTLLASNSQNILVRGPDLTSLKRDRDCEGLLESPHLPYAGKFEDKQWITSVFKPYNKDYYLASVHNEYHGEIHTDNPRCDRARGEDHKCWYTSTNLLLSKDGGYTFEKSDVFDHVMAAPINKYQPGIGRAGISLPIMIGAPDPTVDPSVYLLARGIKPNWSIKPMANERNGAMCLFKGTGINTDNWRFWNGTNFAGKPVNPYTDVVTNPDDHLCHPVLDFTIWSVKYVPAQGVYLAIGRDAKVTASGEKVSVVLYSTSKDLISWSVPSRLMNFKSLSDWGAGDIRPSMYYSLIDPSSPSVNFDTIEGQPYMYFVQWNVDRTKGRILNRERRLLRVPVNITWPTS